MQKLYFFIGLSCSISLFFNKTQAQNQTIASSDYVYDGNGNLTQDVKRGITITYNYLNLPTYIHINGKGVIQYMWDAEGTKLRKTTIDSTVSPIKKTVTLYMGNTVYQNDTLLYIINPEGRTRIVGNNWVHDYFLKDYLGNVRVVITDDYNIESPILEVINYYPFGKEMAGISEVITSNIHNKHLFNGKELQEDLDLNAYDFDKRFYDPQIGSFWQQDPLAEKFPDISPYVFAFDNAIRHIDPTGQSPEDVIINGEKRQAAFEQLQQSVQGYLTLSMDNNGKITYSQIIESPTGNAITPNANVQQLMTAIDDHSIIVNANTTNGTTTPSGNLFIGGAFGGNTVTNNSVLPNGATPPAAINEVITNQILNPTVLASSDAPYGKPGANTLHEITESYQGAKMSQATGISSGNANAPGSVFSAAHAAATQQAGPIYERIYDASGKEMQRLPNGGYPSGIKSVDWYVNDKNGNKVIIQKIP